MAMKTTITVTSVTRGPEKIYKVGSRKSQLAMLQTEFVVKQLQQGYPQHLFQIVGMSTIGDLILDVALAKVGEKSMFTKELELAILTGEVDFVVHSLKDMPTVLPDGLTIASILQREDPRDVMVLGKGQTFDSRFPELTVFGTSSARRRAALRLKYPRARVLDVRGNIQTRLNKLDDPTTPYTALILAAAGLHRLGLADRISLYLTKEEFDWPYAVGQGALGVECKDTNREVIAMLAGLTHPLTYLSCIAERALLHSFGGGCSVPLGVRSFFSTYSEGAAHPDKFTIEGYYYGDYKVLSFTKTISLAFPHFNEHEDLATMTGIAMLQCPDFQTWTCHAIATFGATCGQTFAEQAKTLEKKPIAQVEEVVVAVDLSSGKSSNAPTEMDLEATGSS